LISQINKDVAEISALMIETSLLVNFFFYYQLLESGFDLSGLVQFTDNQLTDNKLTDNKLTDSQKIVITTVTITLAEEALAEEVVSKA